MKKRKSIRSVLLICMLLLFNICCLAQRKPLLSTQEAIRKLESDIPRLMKVTLYVKGDKAMAIACYQKSLALDPANAVQMI